jgi:hypothetical protein
MEKIKDTIEEYNARLEKIDDEVRFLKTRLSEIREMEYQKLKTALLDVADTLVKSNACGRFDIYSSELEIMPAFTISIEKANDNYKVNGIVNFMEYHEMKGIAITKYDSLDDCRLAVRNSCDVDPESVIHEGYDKWVGRKTFIEQSLITSIRAYMDKRILHAEEEKEILMKQLEDVAMIKELKAS